MDKFSGELVCIRSAHGLENNTVFSLLSSRLSMTVEVLIAKQWHRGYIATSAMLVAGQHVEGGKYPVGAVNRLNSDYERVDSLILN